MSVSGDFTVCEPGNELARKGILHEFFEAAVRRSPDRVAVEVPPGASRPVRTRVTYAELDAASNVLARRFRASITGESIVCILLPRTSANVYAAQLAVLKSGAAYACIDPSFPDERIREILEDTGAQVLLTDSAGLARVGACRPGSLACIDVWAALAGPAECAESPNGRCTASWLTPESLAYVIYTSGTTGRPKGVMIEHRSISNLVESDLETFQLSPADRVAQGSSAAYDSSVEETWLALAAGATLVVLDDEAARSGPDLITWLREERITVFCPPPTQLLATGCKDPGTVLPDLKLVYVGGEPLPAGTADIWSRGLQLVNSYGPTECTVTCMRGRIEPGQPVPIGRPIRGVKAWVLTDVLEEAAPGAHGELCIGGAAVARGYWKKLEQTSEKFIVHPQLGRLYRTGDLAHRDAAGLFYCHGRIDSQVKIRGYRIELGEIETRLARCSGVRTAACCVQEDGSGPVLVAFVVRENCPFRPSADRLKAELARVLPGYMVPARIEFLTDLPTTTGGKLNRAKLPRVYEEERPPAPESVPPRNALEAKIQSTITGVLGRSIGDSPDADFFDAGGDSLRAAQLVTLLREDPATAWLTVRDVYEARTAAALAARAPRTPPAEIQPAPSSGSPAHETPQVRPAFVTLVQTAWLLKDLLLGSFLAYAGAFVVLPALTAALGVIPLLLLAAPAALAGLTVYSVLAVRHAVWVKKLLIGRYAPLRAPIWGNFYLRNWIVQQTVRMVPWSLIEGTEFQNAALRALGARIGQKVHIHRGVDLRRGGWDLLEIGDDVTISQDAALGLVEYDAGHIVIGEVSLGNGSTLETNAHVASGARVETNGYLTARSSLPRGGRIPPGERWDGVPARPNGTAPEPPTLVAEQRRWSQWEAGIRMVLARLALPCALAAPAELLAIGAAVFFGVDDDAVTAWLTTPAFNAPLLLAWSLVVMLPVPFMLASEALACRLMGRVRPGVISRWGPGYIRVWLKAELVDSAGRWLYGTLLMPVWLRLAGMKVGQGCEISSLIDSVPELIQIGDRTFCTDGLYLGGPRIHRGTVTLAPAQLGRNNFLGNGAIIPAGVCLPDDVLLGVCTTADPSRLRAGTSWFGHPAFELPRREVIAFDRRLTHNPSAIRYIIRVFWELLRFALPVAVAFIGMAWYVLLAKAQAALSLPTLLLVGIPLLTFGALVATTGLGIAVKWILLGRVRPGVHPLWSSWASRWDFFCLAWSLCAVEAALALDGTRWLSWLLRAAGVRVGRNVMLGSGFAEHLATPDMLRIEDGATVDCLFQDHTFEDRVLKMDYVTVRRNATVGLNAVLLYGAEIGAGSRVAPNSVVMKHERLPAGQNYAGFPVMRQDGDGW